MSVGSVLAQKQTKKKVAIVNAIVALLERMQGGTTKAIINLIRPVPERPN